MITEFDKGGRAAHFKRMFGECIDQDNFEGAMDYLLKYHDVMQNADFHLACGMLYLEMSLDSDDNELLSLAYREFMMHLRRFPECRIAYRNILATLLLRRDTYAFISACKWLKKRGMDFDLTIGELADSGVLFAATSDEPPEFTGLFDGEYGEIDPNARSAAESDETVETEKKSKIIQFDGGSSVGDDKAFHGFDENKILRIKKRGSIDILDDDGNVVDVVDGFEDGDFIDDFISVEADAEQDDDGDFNDFINAYLFDGEEEEPDGDVYDERGKRTAFDNAEDAEMRAVRRAEREYEAGDLDGALSALDGIGRDSEQYYFVLNMRALINMELGQYVEAEDILGDAMEIKPAGALCGSLLCQLYEHEGKTELIPQVLKSIDVGDYANSAHLYKSFFMALKYCNADDALELLEDYIDEFNILDMRLACAQLLYNRGEKKSALDELYILSRICYDDINVRYFYLSARENTEKFEIDTTAPQDVLASLVENVMAVMSVDGVPDEIFDNDMFKYSLEFFLTLEFRNDKRLLIAMFDTLRRIAREPRLREKVKDALVSPYVEPLVKAVLLGELLAQKPDDNFTATFSYVAFCADCERTLGAGYSYGCYVAYAVAAALLPSAVDNVIKLAVELCSYMFTDERDKAFYLIKRAFGKRGVDDRVPYALGYKSKSGALRAYRTATAAIKEKTAKGEIK